MKILLKAFLSTLLALVALTVHAADQDDAAKAAKEILALLQQRQFETLWDSQTSEFFKKRMTKESFMANMTVGRSQLGTANEARFVDMAYSQTDPTTGIKGEIYAFNYATSYTAGKFYERIVVIKEKDGRFRLAGVWGAPATAPTPTSKPQ